MAISSLNTNSNQSLLELFKQRHQATKDLEAQVQSGNISQAQQDLAQIQQANQTLQADLQSNLGGQSSQNGGAGGSGGEPPLGPPAGNPQQANIRSDLTAVFSAVQKGNIADAQSALTKLQSDQSQFLSTLNEAGGVSVAAGSSGVVVVGNDQTDQNSQANDNGLSNFTKTIDSLIGALATGDTKTAKSSLAALQKVLTDLQKAVKENNSSQNNSNATDPSSSSTKSSNSPLDKFIKDLQSLITAAGKGDTAGATQAAKNINDDIAKATAAANSQASSTTQAANTAQTANDTQATSGTQQTSGHHHHHHHHSGSGASAQNSTTDLTALINGQKATPESAGTANADKTTGTPTPTAA